MARKGLAGLFTVAFVAAVTLHSPTAMAQMATGSAALGTVKLPKGVQANGQSLAAGTYSVRLASGGLSPAIGQTPESEQWVEFVQAGQVKGKEVATIVSGPEAKAVLKGKAPAAGSSLVQTLKGNDYIRVWINQGGKHYLIHFATTPS